jgi:hypothetical protein
VDLSTPLCQRSTASFSLNVPLPTNGSGNKQTEHRAPERHEGQDRVDPPSVGYNQKSETREEDQRFPSRPCGGKKIAVPLDQEEEKRDDFE